MCRRNNLRSHIECMDNSFFCIPLSTNNNALYLIECQNHDDKEQYVKECNKRYKETAIKMIRINQFISHEWFIIDGQLTTTYHIFAKRIRHSIL